MACRASLSAFWLLLSSALAIQPGRLIILRHGQSTWNLENRFTGWTNCPLTAFGEDEARQAARLFVEEEPDCRIDVCYTSLLNRATRSAELFLEEYALAHGEAPPVKPRWRLNERHYGVLTGLNKAETQAQWPNRTALKEWRLSFAGKPPPRISLKRGLTWTMWP